MSRRSRIGFGIGNVAFAAFLGLSVYRGLPTRWWVVDGGAALAGGLMALAGVALLAGHKLAPVIARVAAAVTLALGLALVLALAITAAWLSGTYGPVGKGGAAIFGLVMLLVIPYAVAFPAAELLWLGPRAATKRAAG